MSKEDEAKAEASLANDCERASEDAWKRGDHKTARENREWASKHWREADKKRSGK